MIGVQFFKNYVGSTQRECNTHERRETIKKSKVYNNVQHPHGSYTYMRVHNGECKSKTINQDKNQLLKRVSETCLFLGLLPNIPPHIQWRKFNFQLPFLFLSVFLVLTSLNFIVTWLLEQIKIESRKFAEKIVNGKTIVIGEHIGTQRAKMIFFLYYFMMNGFSGGCFEVSGGEKKLTEDKFSFHLPHVGF
jgi:hypothetical protein